jgi:hypothetical protein
MTNKTKYFFTIYLILDFVHEYVHVQNPFLTTYTSWNNKHQPMHQNIYNLYS